MKTTTTFETIMQTYEQYERDVSAVLANLDRTTPTPIIRQLQNSRRADQVARANPATAEDITDHEERHAAALEAIEEVDRISHRITAAQADRIAAAQEGESLRAERDNERNAAADLAKVIARTLSDRADLLQVAAAADLEEPTETEIAAVLGKEQAEDWDEDIIYQLAKLRHRRNAVARYIRAQRGVNALNGMHTDTRAATADEVKAWRASGKGIGADHKQPTKGGYITLEWREQTKSRPSGYYFINRRYTVNQWHSIEQLNESGDITGYIRTQNPYTADLAAVERLESLATAANLTDRERQWLNAFCSPTARRAAAESRRAYHTEQGAKATTKGANAAEYDSRKAYAFNRIGINTDTNRRQFFSRMSRRLAAAAQIEQTCQTPQEYAEKDFLYWKALQEDSRRGTAKEQSRRIDLIGNMHKATEQIHTPQAVHFVQTAPVFYAAAPCVTGWQPRAAKRAAESAAAIVAILDSRIDNTTAENRAKAAQAAERYAAKVKAEAEARAAERAAKAAADHKAKAAANAIRLDVLTLDTTYALWCSWTEEQRAAHMEWLNTL